MSEHTELTSERLAEIAARAEAATPGPWQYDYAAREVMTRHGIAVAEAHLTDEDGRFAAHARTDVPALLAEVERLRARVDEVERRYMFDTADLKQQRDAARQTVAEQQEQLADARPPVRHTPSQDAVWARVHPDDLVDPPQLRWGLDDVEYGDDDSTRVLLSGPGLEPYVLELDEERAAALRTALAGPHGDTARAEVLRVAADELEDADYLMAADYLREMAAAPGDTAGGEGRG